MGWEKYRHLIKDKFVLHPIGDCIKCILEAQNEKVNLVINKENMTHDETTVSDLSPFQRGYTNGEAEYFYRMRVFSSSWLKHENDLKNIQIEDEQQSDIYENMYVTPEYVMSIVNIPKSTNTSLYFFDVIDCNYVNLYYELLRRQTNLKCSNTGAHTGSSGIGLFRVSSMSNSKYDDISTKCNNDLVSGFNRNKETSPYMKVEYSLVASGLGNLNKWDLRGYASIEIGIIGYKPTYIPIKNSNKVVIVGQSSNKLVEYTDINYRFNYEGEWVPETIYKRIVNYKQANYNNISPNIKGWSIPYRYPVLKTDSLEKFNNIIDETSEFNNNFNNYGGIPTLDDITSLYSYMNLEDPYIDYECTYRTVEPEINIILSFFDFLAGGELEFDDDGLYSNN